MLPVHATATGCSWANNGNTITIGTLGANSIISPGDLVYSTTAGIPLWCTVVTVNTNNTVTVQVAGNSSTPLTALGAAAAVTFYKPLDSSKYATAMPQFFGTFVGSVTFYGSGEGINYSPVSPALNGVITSPVTAAGMYNLPLGFSFLVPLCTAFTSGTIAATISFNSTYIPIV